MGKHPMQNFSFFSSIYKAGSGTPCTKNILGLHTLEPQLSMYTKHARPTCRITPILHVRKTLLSYTHSRGNSACKQNTSGLRFGFGSGFECTDWGFWTTLHEKHTTSTCTWTPILHVRKTRLAYIHNYPNSACTQITFFVHAAILHVHIWRWGVLDQQTKNIPHLHALGPQFCMYTSGAGN